MRKRKCKSTILILATEIHILQREIQELRFAVAQLLAQEATEHTTPTAIRWHVGTPTQE